jgi:L-ascorbate metabolism protein UlaG (beta-lactamase superfamily)
MMDKLKVTYLRGPTAILEYAGLRFITDPTFDPSDTSYNIGANLTVRKTAGPVLEDIGKIDVILLSHDQHHDNFDGGGRELARHVATTFTTAAGAERLKGNSIGLQPWESKTITAPNGDEVRITATPARHGPAGIEKISGDVIGFILSFSGSDNFEIYVTGDTVYYEGIAEVARRFNPRYVFIFAGAAQPRGPYHVTMSTNDALDTAAVFRNAIMIPLHYEGWSHYTEGQAELKQSFEALGIGDRLKVLEAGKTEYLALVLQETE